MVIHRFPNRQVRLGNHVYWDFLALFEDMKTGLKMAGAKGNYIFWDDNKRYPIDRITDVRYATSLKAGGCGIRYTCRILGKERYIFLEENKWFVEVKEN